jgi:hypothetical protein
MERETIMRQTMQQHIQILEAKIRQLEDEVCRLTNALAEVILDQEDIGTMPGEILDDLVPGEEPYPQWPTEPGWPYPDQDGEPE